MGRVARAMFCVEAVNMVISWLELETTKDTDSQCLANSWLLYQDIMCV